MRNSSFRTLVKSLDKVHFGNQFPHLKLNRPEITPWNGFKHIVRLIFAPQTDDNNNWQVAITKEILIVVQTENQRQALLPLAQRFGEQAQVLDLRFESDEIKPSEEQLTKLAIKHSLNMLISFFTMTGNDRVVYRKRFYNLHSLLGNYEYAVKLLTQKNSPLKLVIASNDHSGMSNTAFLACLKYNISSLYIQHASVNKGVTPLIMTHAFLDGEDAKNKYLNAGPSDTEISLTGTMKLDPYLSRPDIMNPGKYISVGISVYFCDNDKNYLLCQELEARNIPFIVRFHPNVTPDIREKFTTPGWLISDHRETALDHILQAKAVISGDSTILLEAIMLYRRPIYFASTGVIDFYQYLENGLLDKAYTEIDDLVNSLSKDFDMDLHRQKAKYYNDALYSDYEGQSVERTAQLILEIIAGK